MLVKTVTNPKMLPKWCALIINRLTKTAIEKFFHVEKVFFAFPA